MCSVAKDVNRQDSYIFTDFIPGIEDQNDCAMSFANLNSDYPTNQHPIKLVAFKKLAEKFVQNCFGIFIMHKIILPYSLLALRNSFILISEWYYFFPWTYLLDYPPKVLRYFVLYKEMMANFVDYLHVKYSSSPGILLLTTKTKQAQ